MERKNRKIIEAGDFDQLKDFIFPSIEKAIRYFYHLEEDATTLLSGQLAIVRDVLQKYLEALLRWDRASAPFELISLEKEIKYRAYLPVNANGQEYQVAISGIIDRVDFQAGAVRLIDYKSGQDKKDFPSVDSLFDRDDPKRNKAAMQTMMYGLLYQEKFPENRSPLKPAIYNLKEIFEKDFNPYLQLKEGRTLLGQLDNYLEFHAEFQRGLQGLLAEIMDQDVPFDQTSDPKKCEYCPYKEICGR